MMWQKVFSLKALLGMFREVFDMQTEREYEDIGSR